MGTKKLSEIILDTVLVIVGAALWISAQSIEVGAAMGQGGDFMPKLCSTIWVVLGGLLLASNIMQKNTEEKVKNRSLKGFFATLILLIVYVLCLKSVGFIIMSIFYMFAQMLLFVPKKMLNKKRIITFAAVSVLLPIVVDLLFVNVFSLILPTGILK